MIYYQRNFRGKFPIYEVHDKKKSETGTYIFHVYVYCPFKKGIWGEGFGHRKKLAEQDAAKQAMISLGLLL